MKNQLITLILSLGVVALLSAQGLTIGTYLEQSRISTKLGTAIGYQIPSNFIIGAFYQKSLQEVAIQEFRPETEENEFLGAFITGYLYQSKKIDLNTTIRTGVTNGQNFAITPSVSLLYKPTKRIEFNGGFGVRCFSPTLMTGITLKLN